MKFFFIYEIFLTQSLSGSMFLWRILIFAYISKDRLNQVRTKLKVTWLLLRIYSVQNIGQDKKFKAKDTETRKIKAQKDENLYLPKE